MKHFQLTEEEVKILKVKNIDNIGTHAFILILTCHFLFLFTFSRIHSQCHSFIAYILAFFEVLKKVRTIQQNCKLLLEAQDQNAGYYDSIFYPFYYLRALFFFDDSPLISFFLAFFSFSFLTF